MSLHAACYTLTPGARTAWPLLGRAQVDFLNYVEKLATLGARFDRNAYLYDQVIQVPDRL